DHHRVPRSLARRDTRNRQSIDRCLAAKLPAIKTPVTQTKPKHMLGVGLITPETSGDADVPFHRTHLPTDVGIDAQAVRLAPPLPSGERSERKAIRVRGDKPIESH